jgi:hypothetical protein
MPAASAAVSIRRNWSGSGAFCRHSPRRTCHWKYRRRAPIVSDRPWSLSRVHWVRPELVVQVKFLTWTDDNLLRQVVYEGLREDKPAAEVRRSAPHPKGLVPSEHSSGENVKRFKLTKAGNREARRVLVQAAWCYRFPARIMRPKEPLKSEADKAIRDDAWRAQLRLCKRYRRLIALGKRSPIACAAVARELATFIWELGRSYRYPADF